MENEMVKCERSPKRNGCNKFSFFVAFALILCTIFSSVALVFSVLTFHNNYQRDDLWTVEEAMESDRNWENQVLNELEMEFQRNGQMRFTSARRNKTVATDADRVQRSIDHSSSLDDMCNSTSTSGKHSNTTPLAHIVPLWESGSYKVQITNDPHRDFVMVTKQWICGRPGGNNYPYGVVSGGMVFNRTSGYLILPTNGVYYVYSHMLFKLEGTNETYETSAIMVACIPEQECEFIDPIYYTRFLQSNGVATHFTNRKTSKLSGDNGIYQGGLFHFPAGTQLSLLVKNPKAGLPRRERKKEDKLFTSGLNENSYMGAFLVQEL